MPPFRSAPELKKLPEPVIIACEDTGQDGEQGRSEKRGGAKMRTMTTRSGWGQHVWAATVGFNKKSG